MRSGQTVTVTLETNQHDRPPTTHIHTYRQRECEREGERERDGQRQAVSPSCGVPPACHLPDCRQNTVSVGPVQVAGVVVRGRCGEKHNSDSKQVRTKAGMEWYRCGIRHMK